MWVQGDVFRAEINQNRARANTRLSMKRVTSEIDDISIRDRNNNNDDVISGDGIGDDRLDDRTTIFSVVDRSKVRQKEISRYPPFAENGKIVTEWRVASLVCFESKGAIRTTIVLLMRSDLTEVYRLTQQSTWICRARNIRRIHRRALA